MSHNRQGPYSALLMLLAGVALSAAGFVVDPLGEISDSVLWFVSQSLVYAGSIFGATLYIDNRLAEMSAKCPDTAR